MDDGRSNMLEHDVAAGFCRKTGRETALDFYTATTDLLVRRRRILNCSADFGSESTGPSRSDYAT